MAKRFDRHGKKGVLHYITINIRNRCKAFKAAKNAEAACFNLRKVCDLYPAKLIAYVVMPEHIHCIINPQNGNISHFIALLKPAITLSIVEIAESHKNQQILSWLHDDNKERYRLWQDGKYNFHLYTERLIWQKINYIHTNPIARGLVPTAMDYPYSSYRAMYEGEGIIQIDRDMWWDEFILPDDEP
jgi:REP element-mobilizing transposase RayT